MDSPLGKRVKIKSKFDGKVLTGKCCDVVDWMVGCPVVETSEGLKDIGYYWDLVEILD
jgi:hypothetical protein